MLLETLNYTIKESVNLKKINIKMMGWIGVYSWLTGRRSCLDIVFDSLYNNSRGRIVVWLDQPVEFIENHFHKTVIPYYVDESVTGTFF